MADIFAAMGDSFAASKLFNAIVVGDDRVCVGLKRAKNGINYVSVTLADGGLCCVQFSKLSQAGAYNISETLVKSVEAVSVDSVRGVIEAALGVTL